MSAYVNLNRTVLVKTETTSGTDAVPVVGTNAVLVENPNSNLTLNTFETNEVTGALDARAPIPSDGGQAFSARVYLHGSGSPGVTLPEIDPLLKACGMAPTVNAAVVTGTAVAAAASTITLAAGASAVDDFYRGMVVDITAGTGVGQRAQIKSYVGSTKVATITAPWTTTLKGTGVIPTGGTYSILPCHVYKQVSSSLTTATIYEYLHRSDGGNSQLRKHLGAAGTFTFNLEVSGGCYYEFNMTGSLVAPSDVAPPAVPTTQATRPIPFIDAATCNFNGTIIKMRTLQLDAGNEVAQVQNPNVQFGRDNAAIVRRRSGGTFNAPKELQSVRNVFTSWANGTESYVSAVWGGTAGNRFAVMADHIIATGVTDSDQNGFGYDDLPFRTNLANDSIMITYF
jgi:hypothetical protein